MEDQGADFIQIGASVSVNDEIRANIEEETKELLNFINETKTALENEGGVREKLEKDMMVAKKQTKGIHDDSARVCGDLETFLLTFRGLYHGKVLPGFTLDKQSSLYQGTQHGADETPGVQGEQRSGINDAAAAEQRTREEKEEQIIAHSMREMHKCRDAVAAKHQKLTVDLGRYKAELSESKTVNKELLVKKHRATEEYSRLNAELQDIEAVSKTSSQSLYTEKQRKETLEQKLKELKDSIDKLTQSTSVKVRWFRYITMCARHNRILNKFNSNFFRNVSERTTRRNFPRRKLHWKRRLLKKKKLCARRWTISSKWRKTRNKRVLK